MNDHPIQHFWLRSGWSGPKQPVPELGSIEGQLCMDAWNTAIKVAADQVEHVELTDEQRLELRTKIQKFFYNGVQS